MITAIACTAQILGLGAFLSCVGSLLSNSRSIIAWPCFRWFIVCAVIAYICERIVA